MTGQLPDMPEYARRTEPGRAKQTAALSLQQDQDQMLNDRLRLLLKGVIDELLVIHQEMRAYEYSENLEAIEEALRILPRRG
ncbi:hypothetical protein LOK74_08230 [Brevibacillus humidisoli]|uniref:hypothetical protein n=1 Tax=Brevibacillus humidisoli TaxID=2895522 RepID=UPI001E2A6E66|nr:hypothetical protein [Brevibacillus humidisoli]UFJ42461.1 hypothetical protein LOK74_08230 [Brevibacillus humidisoli]